MKEDKIIAHTETSVKEFLCVFLMRIVRWMLSPAD